jgi:hypothetical protein
MGLRRKQGPARGAELKPATDARGQVGSLSSGSPPHRVIFLDFDGVLNNNRSIAEFGNCYQFDPLCVEALNRILEETGARVVISSSWRCFWSLAENTETLEVNGVLPGRVIDSTPELSVDRGYEIDAWLKSSPAEIVSFVILDDQTDMVMHLDRLVLTTVDEGLTLEHARRAIEILDQPWSHPAR